MTATDTFSRNVRHAARLLASSPGFTLATTLTLALAIGANTAIFSVIRTVLVEPLPYARPESLVMIWNTVEPGEVTHLSLREIISYRDETSGLAALGGYAETNANLTGGDDPERVRAAAVTGDLFETLGVEPLLGRTLVASDSDPGASETVVLGHGLWLRRFGGAPDVVGRTIRVNGRPRTVVGIMPAPFRLPTDYRADRASELWLPLEIDPANLGQWGNRSYFGVGRRISGASAAEVSSELGVIGARWIQAGYVRDDGDGRFARAAVPLDEFITGSVRGPLWILFGTVGVVLLIACANVVNLLLARADARRREMAVRAALGASRADIVRQLLTESVLLALTGGLAGLALAHGAMQLLITLRPAGLPRAEDAAIDLTALAFTGGLSLMVGLLFGLVPALQLSRQDYAPVLNEAARGTAAHVRLAIRRGLVVLQLASSVVLVIGAGLLVRSLIELNRIDLGFDPQGVLTAQIQLPAADYPDDQQVTGFYRQLMASLEAIPGVTAAGGARVLPLARSIGDWSITIEGRPSGPNENPNGDFQFATPGYFDAMGARLVRGRFLSPADHEDAPLAVVVNDTMAARYWPGDEATGRRFQMGGTGTTRPPLTIVGIVRTVRHNAVVEQPRAEMYLAHAQLPRALGSAGRSMAIVLKASGDPLAAAGGLRDAVRRTDPNVPLADIQTMESVTARALAGPRFAGALLGLFALLALTLATIGTYATVSLLVSERRHEIGIRLALGAERRTIFVWILGEGLGLTAVSVALGLAGAIGVTRLLESLLYGVAPHDPLTFSLVPALLIGVATMALVAPARRAASVDPAVTLRQA